MAAFLSAEVKASGEVIELYEAPSGSFSVVVRWQCDTSRHPGGEVLRSYQPVIKTDMLPGAMRITAGGSAFCDWESTRHEE